MTDIPAILKERLPLDELLDYCRHPIKELWVFGSVLGDWRPDSDVDLLVRFWPGEEPELMEIFQMEEELAGLLRRKVDLIQADSVTNPFVRKHIRERRVQVYAA